jgi:hypothetical protein
MDGGGIELKLAGAAKEDVRLPSLDTSVGQLRAIVAEKLGK